jgi:hypothetical protein
MEDCNAPNNQIIVLQTPPSPKKVVTMKMMKKKTCKQTKKKCKSTKEKGTKHCNKQQNNQVKKNNCKI